MRWKWRRDGRKGSKGDRRGSNRGARENRDRPLEETRRGRGEGSRRRRGKSRIKTHALRWHQQVPVVGRRPGGVPRAANRDAEST